MLTSRAGSILHGVARVTIGLSILNDLAQARSDFNSCMAGR
jgi:hypothetical protein